jgi:hypothetical protein
VPFVVAFHPDGSLTSYSEMLPGVSENPVSPQFKIANLVIRCAWMLPARFCRLTGARGDADQQKRSSVPAYSYFWIIRLFRDFRITLREIKDRCQRRESFGIQLSVRMWRRDFIGAAETRSKRTRLDRRDPVRCTRTASPLVHPTRCFY